MTTSIQALTVRLPDGKTLDLPAKATALDAAKQIGAGLAAAALGARVNGDLVDVGRPLLHLYYAHLRAQGLDPTADHGAPTVDLALVTAPRLDKKGRPKYRDDQHKADALYLLRHSTAHVMAEAIERLYPGTQLAYGPPLDTGFYYDLALDTPISSDRFGDIEAEMQKIVEQDRPFTRYELSPDAGLRKLGHEGNKYKSDNANRALQGGATGLTWYVTGHVDTQNIENVTQESGLWEDLCQGPHVDRTARIGAFKVTSVASSYWHGDATSDRFQRVYGTAFFSPQELEDHLELLEQAKARDHRELNKKHHFFAFDEKVGAGLLLWKPKGAMIRQVLQDFISEHLTRQGYRQVFTPHIGKLGLYQTSGHFPYYADSQFPPLLERETVHKLADGCATCAELAQQLTFSDMADGQMPEAVSAAGGGGYLLKPMNCPHHIRIYASEKRSYRDLPVRLAEFGTVYRWEQSGELGGITRTRGFTQDDAHLFVTPDQVDAELMGCIELVKIVFDTLGMTDFRVRVGLRDPDASKFVGNPNDWDAAENACRKAAQSLGVLFSEEPGEAAFYGPKIDFVVKDVIGREWQLGTVQVDYQLPQRFELEYTGADNTAHRPIMIHRAPFGSMERFVGVLIEHFNAAFPLWLSPEQCRVLPVSDKFADYAGQVHEAMKAAGLRAEIDANNDRLGQKIALAAEAKVPYSLVVGGKDRDAGTVTLRCRTRGDLGALPLDTAVQALAFEAASRSATPTVNV
ncbi:MAG: threonine--tRNA ligase [Planctomycetota bacterium]